PAPPPNPASTAPAGPSCGKRGSGGWCRPTSPVRSRPRRRIRRRILRTRAPLRGKTDSILPLAPVGGAGHGHLVEPRLKAERFGDRAPILLLRDQLGQPHHPQHLVAP